MKKQKKDEFYLCNEDNQKIDEPTFLLDQDEFGQFFLLKTKVHKKLEKDSYLEIDNNDEHLEIAEIKSKYGKVRNAPDKKISSKLVHLPKGIDYNHIKATYRNGILSIRGEVLESPPWKRVRIKL